MHILLVESDEAVAESLKTFLQAETLRVEVVNNGEEALEWLRVCVADLVLLNLSLRGVGGTEVVQRMRKAKNSTPVLGMCATAHASPRIDALTAGADDVVSRPIDKAELLARIRAIVRRSHGHSQATLQVGPVQLNLDTQEVHVGDRLVQLTGKEYALFEMMVVRKGMVMTKEMMLSQLYGGMDEPDMKIIDVFVCKLRKKLAEAGAFSIVATVWGRGYIVNDVSRHRAWDSVVPALPVSSNQTDAIQLVSA